MQVDLGEVMATRTIRLTARGGAGGEVLVKIGRPRAFPDNQDYFCPYQIQGIGDEKVRYAGGIDAIQALQLAMARIGADLSALNRACGGRLRWDGDDEGDLGFGGAR